LNFQASSVIKLCLANILLYFVGSLSESLFVSCQIAFTMEGEKDFQIDSMYEMDFQIDSMYEMDAPMFREFNETDYSVNESIFGNIFL